MNHHKTSRVILIVVLTAVVYIVDALTGMIPDVSGLYLIGVVLAAAWFGLVPGLIVAAVALSADIIVHPAALRCLIYEWFASATFETASELSAAMLAHAAPDASPQRDDMSVLVVRAVS